MPTSHHTEPIRRSPRTEEPRLRRRPIVARNWKNPVRKTKKQMKGKRNVNTTGTAVAAVDHTRSSGKSRANGQETESGQQLNASRKRGKEGGAPRPRKKPRTQSGVPRPNQHDGVGHTSDDESFCLEEEEFEEVDDENDWTDSNSEQEDEEEAP